MKVDEAIHEKALVQAQIASKSDELEHAKASAKAALADATARAHEEHSKSQSEIAALLVKIQGVEREVTSITQQRDTANNQIATLSSEKAALSVDIVKLQAVCILVVDFADDIDICFSN